MSKRHSETIDRRGLLKLSAGLFAVGSLNRAAADERPKVVKPRATSGDSIAEPDWEERLTITVGPKQAQLVGDNDKVLQAAVDYVGRFGGGTIHILPGRYHLRNAVYLSSNVRILGSGDDSVLVKEPSVKTKLAADSDWYDQEITLVDAKGFSVGDGVCLKTKNPHNGGIDVAKRTLVARSGNRFKLDRALRQNFWEMGDSTCASLFPLFSGEDIADVVIENVTLDGNKANNENLDGNYAGCVFLQDCNRVAMRKVTARNYNGDGLSWQICHDVVIENCHSHDNTGLGLHPGSGSQRPTIVSNVVERNDIGVFFCWGVKFGLAEKNRIDSCASYGISIGHRDNNNLIRDNDILASGKVGVLFRPERGKSFAPHRNRVENNRIVDSGPEEGVAIDVQGETNEIVLARNEIRESRMPMKRIGIRLGAQTGEVELVENKIEGLAVSVSDLRKT
ncbi:MAG TPA: right-handed parallel beta-helix repeat-containing protein [Planctomycetaceae bacterium]|nr:right-handed parallel beta-helix repeat-containing protein [Planctomycetaceae bacterium]